MTLGALIATHGYWVLALGCLLEGETVLVLAGFAAHAGYLDPVAVVGVASIAGFTGDQSLFWIGRRYGPALETRFAALARQADRVQGLIDRYQTALIVGVRFAYGLRVVGPVLIGMSPVSAPRFAALNAVGALLWACVLAGAGWVFGHAAELLLGRIRHLEGWFMLGIVVAGVLALAIRRLRARASP